MTGANDSITQALSRWMTNLDLTAIPEDVIQATEQRILDVIGLALIGRRSGVGVAILKAGRRLEGSPQAHILGDATRTGMATAALVNGALAEAIEYDDTHNESVVHVGAPVVAAALAAGEAIDASGVDLITAVAGACEITCRLALIACGEFHGRGFHPTGIMGPFGAVYAASKLSGVPDDVMTSAAGIVGSQAAGLLACWFDGTSVKTLHPGWAAHSGIVALEFARAGVTGPAQIFESKWGLLASHIQDASVRLDFARARDELGETWESREISFKPYPAAHVMHGLIEAALDARRGLSVQDIERITCHVAPHWAPIVCEPAALKRRPPSTEAARISLPHTIAEVFVRGRLDASSYTPADLCDPAIQHLADRVHYEIEPGWTDRAVFPGTVRAALRDGREIVARVDSHLGGSRRPLSFEQITDKFRRNAAHCISEPAAICEAVRALRHGAHVRDLVELIHPDGEA
ncbi:MAG TPA: MmgE/PrpD family protein [Steroidobacter sp.]